MDEHLPLQQYRFVAQSGETGQSIVSGTGPYIADDLNDTDRS